MEVMFHYTSGYVYLYFIETVQDPIHHAIHKLVFFSSSASAPCRRNTFHPISTTTVQASHQIAGSTTSPHPIIQSLALTTSALRGDNKSQNIDSPPSVSSLLSLKDSYPESYPERNRENGVWEGAHTRTCTMERVWQIDKQISNHIGKKIHRTY